MRQLFKIFLILLVFSVLVLPSECALKGSLEYKIPIDYTKIDIEELELKGDNYYNLSLQNKDGKIDENITSALNIYTILSNAEPENISYALRLGKLYEIIKKDRWAKANYYRAMGIDKSRPESYFYLAELYYNREQYRKSYKMLIKAQEKGYSEHQNSIEMMKKLNKKLGL